MNKPVTTKEKLLKAAQTLFWTRGYSNVSVRDITGTAGVDAALVSRYFGGKEGLFEATLALIPDWAPLTASGDDLLVQAVESFAHPCDPQTDMVNPFTLLLANVIDPVMGDRMRDLVQERLAEPLAGKLDGELAKERAAMFLAVLFGVALMRKNFQLDGLTGQPTEDLQKQILQVGRAALNFQG